MSTPPAEMSTPFDQLGGRPVVEQLGRAFYAHMAADEPELARAHALDPDGKIAEGTQLRFIEFLVEWLGGPAVYSPRFGHPRLRMRHAQVAIGTDMRDAWLRSMQKALDTVGAEGDVRRFLDGRFAEVADFLRNRAGN